MRALRAYFKRQARGRGPRALEEKGGDQQVLDVEGGCNLGTSTGLSELPEVWIKPDSRFTKAQSVLGPRQLTEACFRIGRRGAYVTQESGESLDYSIAQEQPYTISKQQCTLERIPGGVVVRDLDSRNGTLVDGVRLGLRHNGQDTMVLGEGVHQLAFGVSGQRYRFLIEVGECGV